MSRIIEFDNQPLATLIEGKGDAPYIVPPIVTVAGELRWGTELLTAVIKSGSAINHPVVALATEAEFQSMVDRVNKVGESLAVRVAW